jgi:hypothetical protein
MVDRPAGGTYPSWIAEPDWQGCSCRMSRPQKITIAEVRSMGLSRLLVYCGDHRCSHSIVVDAGQWSDDVRLSDLEPRLICKVCGHRGADVRPMFEEARRRRRPAITAPPSINPPDAEADQAG